MPKESYVVYVKFDTADKADHFANWLVKHAAYDYRYYSYATNARNGIQMFIRNTNRDVPKHIIEITGSGDL